MYKLSLALILGLGVGSLVVGCGGGGGTDTEDGTPVFVSDYSISYLGDSEVVFTANATDSDGDKVTYSLGGDDAKYFTINKDTGEVKFALDADDINELAEFGFFVIASDGTHTAQKPAHVSGLPSAYKPKPIDKIIREGHAVAQYGDYIAVGDHKNGNVGRVYIYKKDGNGNVSLIDTIGASDRNLYDNFGKSVALNKDFLIVGAPYDDDKGYNAGAAYAYHYGGTDDFGSETKFYPQFSGVNDLFGYSMDIDGENLVVGFPGRGSGCVEALDNAQSIIFPMFTFPAGGGGVYLFTVNVAEIPVVETLSGNAYIRIIERDSAHTNCVTSVGDWFGKSVSIDGNHVIVGAPYDDENGLNAGATYRYSINNNIEFYGGKKFFGSNTNDKDYFGTSVDIDNGRIVVGAPGVVNFDKSINYGAAYVFDDSLAQQGSVLYDDTPIKKISANNRFGTSVAINYFGTLGIGGSAMKEYVAVGAPGDDTNAANAGAVHIFEDTARSFDYTLKNKILGDGSSAPYLFGKSVSLFGHVLSPSTVAIGDGNLTAVYTEIIE